MQKKLPVLFVTHGSPMLSVDNDPTTLLFKKIGQNLSKEYSIKAILVISAHWITNNGLKITASDKLTAIHDFFGFPDALYQLEYDVNGDPNLATQIKDMLKNKDVSIELDFLRGLDHGAWVPLRYLFPEANIPVLQISMNWPINPKDALNMGQQLNELREQGILIITSGSMTHNLGDIGYDNNPKSYIQPFIDWMRNTLKTRDTEQLINYRTLAPYAINAHPRDEHFIPLIIAFGASDSNDDIEEYYSGVSYNALAMDHYLFKAK